MFDQEEFEKEVERIKDSIFAPNVNWPYNAFVDPVWEVFVTGYKQGADHLVNSAVAKHEQDLLVYPVVFLYRHYLELRLKELILALQCYHDLPGKLPTHHDLVQLWQVVRPLLERVWGSPEEVAHNNAIEARVKEFSLIDEGSFAFRYPVTKAGDSSLNNVPKQNGQVMLNLLQMKEVVTGIAHLLDGASQGLSVYLDYKAEMRAEYEADMRREYQGEY